MADTGWHLTTDPTTGNQYWYHEGTGETKWVEEPETGEENSGEIELKSANPLYDDNNVSVVKPVKGSKKAKSKPTKQKKKLSAVRIHLGLRAPGIPGNWS